jgi:hypothetical protein
MAKILTIYCEGKRGSHDFDILEKVAGDTPFCGLALRCQCNSVTEVSAFTAQKKR